MIRIKSEIVNDLLPAALNPKDHDLGSLITSICRFGFTAPLIVNDHTGRLLAGHGRAEALLKMWSDGETPPKGVSVDKATGQWKVPVVRGISIEDEREADAYLIADNRLTEAGSWHLEDLSSMLADLVKDGVSLDGLGFDGDDLDEMLKDVGGDAKPVPDPPGDPGEDRYKEQYGVIIICDSAEQQEQIYNEMTDSGYNVKIVVT
jgi:ParB-like chromosome segregation protein Spo0J